MTPKTRDKECTAFRYKAGGAVADVEKKRKLFNCSEHYIRIKQIKSALAAVVAEIDPKDATTSEVIGHLTKSHVRSRQLAVSWLAIAACRGR